MTRGGQVERCPHLERVETGVQDEDSVCWTRLFFFLCCTGCKQAGQLKTTGSEDPAATKPGSFLLLPKQHNSRWQLRLPQFLGRPTSGHPEHSILCICRHGQRVECSQALNHRTLVSTLCSTALGSSTAHSRSSNKCLGTRSPGL